MKKDFRILMKETRKVYKIKQREFAYNLGITPKHLSQIENCVVYPSWPLLFEMLDKLGLKIEVKFNNEQQ